MSEAVASLDQPPEAEAPGSPFRLPDRQFSAIAKALADPTRYRIVMDIASARSALPCCSLRAAEAVSAATISHHIKSLEKAGLIEVQREGKYALLSFRRDVFDAYLRQLSDALGGAA